MRHPTPKERYGVAALEIARLMAGDYLKAKLPTVRTRNGVRFAYVWLELKEAPDDGTIIAKVITSGHTRLYQKGDTIKVEKGQIVDTLTREQFDKHALGGL